uniref:Uncharacterized protein n=1 Tax=Romanomermis culicivorax TaxID=13658 RepID=A0A915I8A6_ROMCU
MPSAGKRSPYLTMQMSPTTNSPTKICICSPLRMTANLCSPSILACKPRNCFSFVPENFEHCVRRILLMINKELSFLDIRCIDFTIDIFDLKMLALRKCKQPTNRRKKKRYINVSSLALEISEQRIYSQDMKKTLNTVAFLNSVNRGVQKEACNGSVEQYCVANQLIICPKV